MPLIVTVNENDPARTIASGAVRRTTTWRPCVANALCPTADASKGAIDIGLAPVGAASAMRRRHVSVGDELLADELLFVWHQPPSSASGAWARRSSLRGLQWTYRAISATCNSLYGCCRVWRPPPAEPRRLGRRRGPARPPCSSGTLKPPWSPGARSSCEPSPDA